MNPLSHNKAWSYVGRFVCSFAMIEGAVDQLLLELIGSWQNQRTMTVALFVTYSFDMRKKLALIDVIYKSRGVDESKTFKKLQELHDLRNVVVHYPFVEEIDQARLSCDYIDKYGSTVFKLFGSSRKDDSITYAEFDSYNVIANELFNKLNELLATATPVAEVSDELRDAMKEVIDSSIH
jgi:hypothetical protein